MATRSLPATQMLEAELLRNVIELAELLKWRVAHFRPGMNRRGHWSTAMSGSQAAGFPDLVLVRDDHLVFVELKSARGRLTDAQTLWLQALGFVASVATWRPADWVDGTVERVLRGKS